MRASRVILAVAAVALVAGAGCKKKVMQVVRDGPNTDDFGHAAVLAAVDEMTKTPDSPQAYRHLAVTIAGLRPRFNQVVEAEAERALAFLALRPLARATAEPALQEAASLALTVWPVAFRLEPNPGETVRQFLERACTTTLAGECRYVVPEVWGVVLGAKAWRRMKNRAHEAYARCQQCQEDPSFHGVLEDYDRYDTEWQARAAKLGDGGTPGFWPQAGEHAREWSGAPLLELGAGDVSFDGLVVEEHDWRGTIKDRRGDARVLGIHLRPRQEVRVLRSALADAGAAGYAEVALQVRETKYPYTPREYRIAVAGGKRAIMVREVDSIQVLVRALDAAAARLASAGDLSPAVLSL